jgi:hypothetical protein
VRLHCRGKRARRQQKQADNPPLQQCAPISHPAMISHKTTRNQDRWPNFLAAGTELGIVK